MDKFVVDLDKVLDEFEKEEEAGHSRAACDFTGDGALESSGYDSLRTSSEFILAAAQPHHFTDLTATATVQVQPTVYEEKIATSDRHVSTLVPTNESDHSSTHSCDSNIRDEDTITPFVSSNVHEEPGQQTELFTSTGEPCKTPSDSVNISYSAVDEIHNDASSSFISNQVNDDNNLTLDRASDISDDNITECERSNVASFKLTEIEVDDDEMDSYLADMKDSTSEPPPIAPPELPGPQNPKVNKSWSDATDSAAPHEIDAVGSLPSATSFRRPLSFSRTSPSSASSSMQTPTEDVGFSRVPGLVTMEASNVEQELEKSIDKSISSDSSGPSTAFTSLSSDSLPSISQRPSSPPSNQVPPKKKARPNSLLGLSVPTPPSELVRIEQAQKHLSEHQPAENVSLSRRTIVAPPCITISYPSEPKLLLPTNSQEDSAVMGGLSEVPFSTLPMDCYEEIENPLYVNRGSGEAPSGPAENSTGVNDATLPSLRRPCFLPIPTRQEAGSSEVNDDSQPTRPSGLFAKQALLRSTSTGSESSAEGSGVPSTTSSTLTPNTETTIDNASETLMSPQQQSDSISGDSPTTSIASSVSSIWSGIAEEDIGHREPTWAKDESSVQCMSCAARFTVWRRRHHCRACGKLLCGQCCGFRMRLDFIRGTGKARVCAKCFQQLVRLESSEARGGPNGSSRTSPQPTSSALKRHRPSIGSGTGAGASKSVMFSDGIRPGGDLTEMDAPRLTTPTRPVDAYRSLLSPAIEGMPGATETEVADEDVSLVPPTGISKLPPLVVQSSGELLLQMDPKNESVAEMFANLNQPPVVFAVTRNVHVLVRMTSLSCCVGQTVWCFCSRGLETIGQEEVVIVLECAVEETLPPLDIFRHYYQLYKEAKSTSTPDRKSPFTEFSCLLSHSGLFGVKDYAGFLYIRPTYQCVQNLVLPVGTPYIIGVLIQRWEAPWAKLFPLRLMLRMGIHARYYPCPLVSTRDRGPLFGEIGHTVVQLLADFRDYRFTLPTIPGLWIHLSCGEMRVTIPKASYSSVMKVISERHDDSLVLALGAVLSRDADSHLVCMQKEDDGQYITQAISIENTERKVTGASFIVFNGSQRQTRSSIVEDGVIVQLKSNQLHELINQLKASQPVTFVCDRSTDTGEIGPEETVAVVWTDERQGAGPLPPGQVSWVDGRPLSELDGDSLVASFRVPPEHQLVHWQRLGLGSSSVSCGGLRLAWTRVHTLVCSSDCEDQSTGEPVDTGRIAEQVADAFVMALGPHLSPLREADLIRLGLQVTLDPEKVGYEVGCARLDDSTGVRLPEFCLVDLDSALVPVLHPKAAQIGGGPLVLELNFHILD